MKFENVYFIGFFTLVSLGIIGMAVNDLTKTDFEICMEQEISNMTDKEQLKYCTEKHRKN